jgi:GNAT superfamily N-acetyltransferase
MALMPTAPPASNPRTDSIHIEPIRVKDLPAFAEEFFAHPEGQVTAPITQLRARAQSKNPNADANDIGMFVAYDGRKCVGYRGVLPMLLQHGQNTSKIYWASSFFVLPDYRRQKLGQLLVKRWMQIGDVAATGSTDAAMAVYQRCGFREAGPLDYLAIKLEGLNRAASPFRALQRRLQDESILRRLARLAVDKTDRWFYPPARSRFYQVLSAHCHAALQEARFRQVERLSPALAVPRPSEPHFHRSIPTINWMLEYHWFSESAQPSTPPCYFSDRRELFRYQAYELQDNEHKPAGFVVLLAWRAQHRSVVKLLDRHLPDVSARQTAFWLAMRLAAEHGVDRIELPIEFEPLANQLPSAARLVSITRRRYFLHPIDGQSSLARAINSLKLDYCDGDLAFY